MAIIPPVRSTGRPRTRKTPASPFKAPAAAPRPPNLFESLRTERVLGMFNGGFPGALRVDLRPLPRHATTSRTALPCGHGLRRPGSFRPHVAWQVGKCTPKPATSGSTTAGPTLSCSHKVAERSCTSREELCDPGARSWQQESQKSSCGAATTGLDLQVRLLGKSVTRCTAACSSPWDPLGVPPCLPSR